MIIYNVTTNIHESVHDQWMIWTAQTHSMRNFSYGKIFFCSLVRVLIEEKCNLLGAVYNRQQRNPTLEKPL
jgi:hypothetical protein